MDIDLDLTRIEEAARIVDPAFRDSPQFVSGEMAAALGRDVIVKVETVNPLGSFKGRGADFLVRSLPRGSSVVCASSGNFGVALAYAGRTRGMGVHVYVSPGISPGRRARMQSLGAGSARSTATPRRRRAPTRLHIRTACSPITTRRSPRARGPSAWNSCGRAALTPWYSRSVTRR